MSSRLPTPWSRLSWLPALAFALLASCDDSPPTVTSADPKELYPDGCDPLVPTVCGYPFPSDIWLVDDPATPTGRHVEMPSTYVPTSEGGGTTDLSLLRRSDGFSPGMGLATHLPGATTTGLADSAHIADSLLADSPTVLLDTVTGERIPHWAELDQRSYDSPTPEDTPDGPRALLIRPAIRLEDARRYVVAIRNVVDTSGTPIAPSPAFAALKNGRGLDHPSIRARRAKYAELFATLASAGIAKDELQIAWDFTTSSEANQTAGLVAMRDRAYDFLATQPNGSPGFRITSVQDDVDAHVARRIEGFVTVPMYLDSTEPGGVMTYDEAGLPVQQGTAELPFLLVIPYGAASAPSPVMHFGHGLFASYKSADDPTLRAIADQMGVVVLSLDWLGLTKSDLATIAGVLTGGDLSAFRTVPERGMQAILNNLVALRMVTKGLVTDASTQIDGHATIDPSRVFYWGVSLGGIYGSTYMALTPDVERGILGVPGESFDLILPRSAYFDVFLNLLQTSYADFARYPQLLGIVQMLWDRVEPTGFSRHVLDERLPGTRTHRVMMIDAIGDHRVSTLAAHVMARTLHLPIVGPPNRMPYGLPIVDGPVDGSGLVELDFGLPPEPVTNVPARAGMDPHDSPWAVPVVVEMIQHFAETGQIVSLCSGTCNPD